MEIANALVITISLLLTLFRVMGFILNFNHKRATPIKGMHP